MMNHTINDLLKIEPFTEMQLIAGKDGLEHEVRFAGVLEAPDSYQFVREGEFLLSTGFLLSQEETALEHAVEVLHEKKAAGLGIKLFRYLTTIPEHTVALANRYAFPIFFIPNKYAWHDLLMPLLLYINASGQEKDSFPAFEQLTRLLHRTQPVSELLSSSSAVLSHPLSLVHTASLSVISGTPDVPLPRPLTAELLSLFHGAASLPLSDGSIHYYHSPESFDTLTADLDSQDFQELILWNAPTPRNPAAFHTAVCSLILLRDAVLTQASRQRSQIYRKNTLLLELLHTAAPSVDAAGFRGLQLDPAGYYLTALARSDGNQLSFPDITLAHCFESLFQYHQIHSCIDEKGLLHFLIPVPEDPQPVSETAARRAAQTVRKTLQDAFPERRFLVLTGRTAEGLPAFAGCDTENRDALRLIPASASDVVSLHELGILPLLADKKVDRRMETFCQAYFAGFSQCSTALQKTLYETLNAYLTAGFNYREAARLLGVHHNTVRNRLEQFTDLTGLSLTHPDDLLTILTCLKWKELHSDSGDACSSPARL